MTLIMAVGCKDGAILASDSSSADALSGVKIAVNKVRRIAGQPILWGGSGDVGTIQKFEAQLSGFNTSGGLQKVRAELQRRIVVALKDAYGSWVNVPQNAGLGGPPSATALFAGIVSGKVFVLEVERDGRDTIYGEEYGNVTSIGSGKPWAQAGFSLHLKLQRDMKLGKIITYRILEDSINLASGGLSMPIHMSTIDLLGNVSEVDDMELQGLRTTSEVWRSLEREAVGKLLDPPAAAAAAAVPEPQNVVPEAAATPPSPAAEKPSIITTAKK